MFKLFLEDQSGQAVVEYVLLLGAVVSIGMLMREAIKEITVRMWETLAVKIAAPCADLTACTPGGGFDLTN